MQSVRYALERPIGGRPQAAFVIAAAVLLTAAGVLALLPDGTSPEPKIPATSAERSANPTRAAVAAPIDDLAATPGRQRSGGRPHDQAAVVRGARRFLVGYLPYLYGRAPATNIAGAGRVLRRRLAAATLRVSPAARDRSPRVVQVTARTLRRGRWHVVATIADGGVSRYPIELLITTSTPTATVQAVVSQ